MKAYGVARDLIFRAGIFACQVSRHRQLQWDRAFDGAEITMIDGRSRHYRKASMGPRL